MPRANLTPRSVVTAAADLADAASFDDVTLTAVARRLGVQTASLYSHVRDRAALLDGVHQLALDELADRITAAIAGRAGTDALVGWAEAHRSLAGESPGRWAALQRTASPATAQSAAAGRVADLTLAVLRGYRLPDAELVHATRMLGASINGFLTLERSGAFGHRSPDPEVSWRRMLQALDGLLRSWSSTVITTTEQDS